MVAGAALWVNWTASGAEGAGDGAPAGAVVPVTMGASEAPRSTGGAYVVPHAIAVSDTSNRTCETLFIITLE